MESTPMVAPPAPEHGVPPEPAGGDAAEGDAEKQVARTTVEDDMGKSSSLRSRLKLSSDAPVFVPCFMPAPPAPPAAGAPAGDDEDEGEIRTSLRTKLVASAKPFEPLFNVTFDPTTYNGRLITPERAAAATARVRAIRAAVKARRRRGRLRSSRREGRKARLATARRAKRARARARSARRASLGARPRRAPKAARAAVTRATPPRRTRQQNRVPRGGSRKSSCAAASLQRAQLFHASAQRRASSATAAQRHNEPRTLKVSQCHTAALGAMCQVDSGATLSN